MWKAPLVWVQDGELMSYTLLNIISLSDVISLCPSAIHALDSGGSCVAAQGGACRGNPDAQPFFSGDRHVYS